LSIPSNGSIPAITYTHPHTDELSFFDLLGPAQSYLPARRLLPFRQQFENTRRDLSWNEFRA